ncbi:tRNA (adenosine(37)-N6)-threonylcarbamoyltransferase complex transferase subunit TsaD [Candidatus Peregrinibacteria bacterium]|nr:tRNA (adenosine(37)-N6)-threonylcarbamoyltransferase complex transferase subunit TsaD [Candidatus Peregrinibacteria bacterium]
MRILGIETSCDETSCAVVQNGREVLSNVIFSQVPLHRETGGVVPEVAAREHVVKIIPVLKEALKKAKLRLHDIDAVAVTYGPGLLSSLLIGVNAAMTLALVLKKPLIPVNHIEGHIYANLLSSAVSNQTSHAKRRIAFPAAVLTVSGGHNELLIWDAHGRYRFLGATLDDAAGEAFDKVARLLGLPYPGGPHIQKWAKEGNPSLYPLPRAWLPEHPWDFSFSGLKTAVLRLVQTQKKRSPKFVADSAASFQESVCEVLAAKLVNASKKYRVKEIHLAGGVSANSRLREWTADLIGKNFPDRVKPLLRYCEDITFCTDNAAMIAAAGFYKYEKTPSLYQKWRPITADPNLDVKNW